MFWFHFWWARGWFPLECEREHRKDGESPFGLEQALVEPTTT
jgi:hypothetical protein